MNNIYLEKAKKVKDLEVKLLEAETELQRLNAKIKEASKHSKCLFIIKKGVESPTISVSLPKKSSSSHGGIFKDMQIEHPSNDPISKPLESSQKIISFNKVPQTIDSEEEIFIVDPPCQPSVVNMLEETSETVAGSYEEVRCKINLDNCHLVDSEIRSIESNSSNKKKNASNTLAPTLEDIMPLDGNSLSIGSPNDFTKKSEKPLVNPIDDCLSHESSCCYANNRGNFDVMLQPEMGEVSYADGCHVHDHCSGKCDCIEIDGKYTKWGKKHEARQSVISPVKVNVPVRRQVSLGDLSNENEVISIGPKRWSHQLELLTHHDSFVVLKPSKRGGGLKGNLRRKQSSRTMTPSDKKVRFDPIALLFNAAVEGELGVVRDAIYKVYYMKCLKAFWLIKSKKSLLLSVSNFVF